MLSLKIYSSVTGKSEVILKKHQPMLVFQHMLQVMYSKLLIICVQLIRTQLCLCCLPDLIMIIKLRVRWMGHVALMGR
jgi:hypothetical protein